ncbi:hypothetical protein FUAX_19550 [Fulvitalea axinellae]|uniref:Periplasmic nitrate reductase, electron transfer subunit n=1 Tax=Fulvitalea axinellae TaxID=1182444 RepID=A0AAU9CHJ8_9BACT|nr:hypothetical protein FUAX_19550 [Fulvitalea axinellae]
MKRLGIISLFALLFIGFVTVLDSTIRSSMDEANVPLKVSSVKSIPSEEGVFKRSNLGKRYLDMPVDETHQRSLKTYYDNRAYHGAPPSIPHPVKSERSMGGKDCLKCHQDGGFVAKYKAYAPVTPHPEMANCRQCHVPQQTNKVFKQTKFHKVPAPKAGVNNALPGSPPAIPHQIQMRENCLSCHAGPAAPKEIRVSHPDRSNCRQCHVVNNKEVTDIGNFIRSKNNE